MASFKDGKCCGCDLVEERVVVNCAIETLRCRHAKGGRAGPSYRPGPSPLASSDAEASGPSSTHSAATTQPACG